MSVLRLQLQGTDSIAPAIAVEVVNTDLETVAQVSLSGHEQQDVEVTPGNYLIRAMLPSGELVKVKATVADSEQKQVVLSPSVSAHPWLNWQHFLGNVVPVLSSVVSAPGRSPFLFQSTWLRLWTYHNQRWSVEALPLREAGQDQSVINYCLDVSEAEAQQVRLLQLGGTQVPWRFVALPPASRLEVLIRPTSEKAAVNDSLAVAVVSHNGKSETLLHYLAAGNLESAKIVGRELASAEALLNEKLTNPMGAAVAGYYLLRVGATERLQQWAEHFANQFNWLPDALIIHAWQLLQQSQPNLALAEQRLLQASQRGIPLYSPGLRLLFDGLQLFQKQPIDQPELNRAVAEALKVVQPYAAAVDWSQPLTTFYGETPDRPLLSAHIGIPDNQTGLVWLPAPQQIPAPQPAPENTRGSIQTLLQAPSAPDVTMPDRGDLTSRSVSTRVNSSSVSINPFPVVHLSQWLPDLVDDTWRSIKDVFGLERAGLIFAFRKAPSSNSVARAKLIDLKENLETDRQTGETKTSIVLVIEFIPAEDNTAKIWVQVHPAPEQPFLPPNLEVTVSDPDTEKVILHTQSKLADNRLQLELNGALGDRFRVEMKLDRAVAIEQFVI